MPTCVKCESEIRDGRCPVCGRDTAESAKKANKSVQNFIFISWAGLVSTLLVNRFYPLLDGNTMLLFSVCVFLGPMLMNIGFAVRKRVTQNVTLLRRAYLYSGELLLLMSAVVLINGALDRSPATNIRTWVIDKSITGGKSGATYTVFVSSWRPGRAKERLVVSRERYYMLPLGGSVMVQMHKGSFGLPWHGEVMPSGVMVKR